MAKYDKFSRYHNAKILEQGLEAYIKNGAKPMMRKKLVDIAKELQAEIANDTNIPVYTGNHRNSVGVVVLDNGSIIKASLGPDPIPTNPPHVQSVGAAASGAYGRPIYNIVGTEYRQKAVNYESAMAKGLGALHIIVFAAVPYAAYINEYGSKLGRGQAFFNELVGWNLVNKIGREFSKGNKKFIEESYRLVQ